MHGEPAGGGNLWVRDGNIRCWVALSPGEDGDRARGGHPPQRSRYLLHSGTKDVIALVIGNLD